jgi:hypothetical protein
MGQLANVGAQAVPLIQTFLHALLVAPTSCAARPNFVIPEGNLTGANM